MLDASPPSRIESTTIDTDLGTFLVCATEIGVFHFLPIDRPVPPALVEYGVYTTNGFSQGFEAIVRSVGEGLTASQFDAVVHLDHTSAVRPLDRTELWDAGEPPETYPSGL